MLSVLLSDVNIHQIWLGNNAQEVGKLSHSLFVMNNSEGVCVKVNLWILQIVLCNLFFKISL